MPGSETPEADTVEPERSGEAASSPEGSPSADGGSVPGPSAESLLERTAAGLEALLERTARLRERAEHAEALQRRMAEALAEGDLESMSAAELQERLAGLAEENRRLREVLEEARERADRIRSRLMVVEDET